MDNSKSHKMISSKMVNSHHTTTITSVVDGRAAADTSSKTPTPTTVAQTTSPVTTARTVTSSAEMRWEPISLRLTKKVAKNMTISRLFRTQLSRDNTTPATEAVVAHTAAGVAKVKVKTASKLKDKATIGVITTITEVAIPVDTKPSTTVATSPTLNNSSTVVWTAARKKSALVAPWTATSKSMQSLPMRKTTENRFLLFHY